MSPRQIAAALLLLIVLPAFGQADSSRVTLERLYSSNYFAGDYLGPVRWLEDGAGYTRLESSEAYPEAREIVRYDAATGERSILVPASRLVPEGGVEPLEIEDYAWSADAGKLLIFTNSRRVWRYNTRGDYWVLDLTTGRLHQLGGSEAAPSTLMFATFAPDASRVAYVREHNLYVENLANGKVTPLTTDGSDTLINGTFDWVNEEEFGLRNGFRWSPDGTRIAYWQLDASGEGVFYLINNTDSLYSRVIPIQYPKAGTTNASIRVGVVPAAGGETTWFEEEDDPRNHYIARMEWAANSDEIIVQHLNRLQNTLDVLIGDVATGRFRRVLRETDEAWIDVVDDWQWMDDESRFLWVSERDGWRHVYIVSRDGSDLDLVTRGEFDVEEIRSVDQSGGWLYYTASPDDPTQRYLFRTRLDGTGVPQRLSPAGEPGTHTYQIAPGASWAVHTYSRFGLPPVTDVVHLPDHRVARTLVDNARLTDRVQDLERGQVRFFRVDADGVALDGWEMRPPDFDSTKTYPVLFYVYGEPAGQTVLDRWGGSSYLWHLMLTQQGYLVMSVDNRGTPAPRGRAWRKSIYGKVGVISSVDQAAAARRIATWDYVDPDRIGVWGWSGGGSMTLNMMFRYPDLYSTGMSVAPVPDQRYYDTIYQERYMGLPQENPAAYREGSPITFAGGLEGDLLIVHGTGDDNVHYQGTEALINELVSLNKPFTMMAYPNRSHGIYEGAGTSRHLFELLTRYLNENLPVDP